MLVTLFEGVLESDATAIIRMMFAESTAFPERGGPLTAPEPKGSTDFGVL